LETADPGIAFTLAELHGLREEMNCRIGIQNACLVATAALIPLSLAVQIAAPAQALLGALAACVAIGLLALIWCHNGVRQSQLHLYLRGLEKRLSADGGWEHWLPCHPVPGPLGSRWFISTKGGFIGAQGAIVAGGLWLQGTPVLLTALPLLAIGCTAWLLLTNPELS
jgi:hypothetical protein